MSIIIKEGDELHKLLSNKKVICFLVLPGFIIFTFAVLFPIFLSVFYGMTDWSGIGDYTFIGSQNFKEVILDGSFWASLKNAFILALLTIFVQHPIALLFAVFLDEIGGKMEKVFRTLLFIPCVISIVVTSKMWVSIYDSQYGMLNKILDGLGLGFLKQQWLADPKIALYSLIIIIMWQGFGWALIIYYSGVKGISSEVYEAAKIDGASNAKVFTKITVPLLKPVITINVTLAVISSLKQMETIYLTTNGGPGNKTQFLANYLYIQAFNSSRYGYGNAISVLFVIMCLITTVLLNKILRSDKVEY